MLSETEIKNMLLTKEKQRKDLEYEKLDAVEKMKEDYKLTIEISLLKTILN